MRAAVEYISVRDIRPVAHHPYLIETLVPERSVVLLSAPSNAGKTATLLHLAASLLEERPAFGALAVHNADRRPVLYVNGEMSRLDFKRYALAAAHGLDLERDSERLFLPCSGERGEIFFGDGRLERFDAICEFLTEKRPALVIIDTLRSLFEIDENDQERIGVIGRSLHALASRYNCSVLLAHHTRKPGPYGGGVQAAVAGSAHIVGMADTHIALRAAGGKFAHRLDVIKDRRRTHGGAIAYAIVASMTAGVSRISVQPMRQRQDKEKMVLDLIREIVREIGPASQAELMKRGIGRRRIESLRQEGLLRDCGRGKGRTVLLDVV